MAKYIVTGCAGFIGSNLVDRLLKDGHKITGVDNLSSGLRENMPLRNKNFVFVDLDIREFDTIYTQGKAFDSIDGIFHVAAQARIQPTIEKPYLAHKNNVDGTYEVLEFMRRREIKKIVYSSSSSVYGKKNKCPLQENMPNDCLNPYSLSKFVGEQYLKTYYKAYGIQGISLRYFNVWGPREVIHIGQYSPLIGLFFKEALVDKTPLTIVGDGNQTRDMTHIDDVIEANVQAMIRLNDDYAGQVLNVGSGKSYSILEVADAVLESLGLPEDLKIFLPPRPGEAQDTLASITRSRIILRWKPTIFLKEKLNEHRDYYKKKWNI